MSSMLAWRPNQVDTDAVIAVVVVERAGEVVARWRLPRAGTAVHLGHVDALARLCLAGHALGGRTRVEQAAQGLVELLDLAGLRRQVLGEPERCEEPALLLEEAVVPDDRRR